MLRNKKILGALCVLAFLGVAFRGAIISLISTDNSTDNIDRIERVDPTPENTPTITAPQTCQVGELVTISVSGAALASWSVTPDIPVYIDSNTVSLVFSSHKEGTFVVFASVVLNNAPIALTTSVSVGDTDDNQEDSDKEDSDRDNTGLETTIRKSLPADQAIREKLVTAFDAVTSTIDKKSVISLDGAFAALRRETISCLTEPTAVKFLDEITNVVRTEALTEDSLEAVRDLFQRIADTIRRATKNRDPPATKGSVVSPVSTVRSPSSRICTSGNCSQ